jgi:hypothetical protein
MLVRTMHRTVLVRLARLSILALLGLIVLPAMPSGANPLLGGFAGYLTNPSKMATKASATFTVPALKCKHVMAPEVIGATVSLLGVPGPQGPPGVLAAVVDISCVNMSSNYQAMWFLFSGPGPQSVMGGQFTITIASGDTITESVTSGSSGSNVTIDDTTSKMSGATKKHSLPGISASSSKVGLVCPGLDYQCPSIPNFGSVKFTSATVNSKAIAKATPDEFQIGHITTSALGSDGESFTETYS